MILKGDCIEVMKAMKPNSVDAIVTDPPYGLEFMGKEWDQLKAHGHWDGKRGWQGDIKDAYGRYQGTAPSQYKAGIEAQLWHAQWLTEAYRVLKPGASMLVMGGTRTSHRLTCAIEDSGFIIKDTLMWIYGSGFPKAQDLGKKIDKKMGKERKVIGINPNHRGKSQYHNQFTKKLGQDGSVSIPTTDLAKHWDGFKVGGIKPAYEPIIWAVKPPEGSYVDNVLKHGVGAVNVDECRIGYQNEDDFEQHKRKDHLTKSDSVGYGSDNWIKKGIPKSKGRFPANVILSHHPECVQVGMKKVKNQGGVSDRDTVKNSKPTFTSEEHTSTIHHFEKNGYETVESWDCHPDCAVRLLDEQSGILKSGANPERRNSAKTKTCYGEFEGQKNCMSYRGQDSGGASRFFYCAKASRSERNMGLEGMEEKELDHNRFDKCAKCGGYIFQNPDRNSACKCEQPQREHNKIKGNAHPTVKPIKLFEWLIKLVTREGQIILDPFIGSGTTAIAVHDTGRKCIGIEKEGEYIEIAKKRATYWRSRPRQLEMTGG